jgi:pantoate--beta-alanine ligase
MNLNLNHPVAFVPTMGALHAGHESLIRIAKELADEVVVSVFVNPLQFENAEDFSIYPKMVDADRKLAEASGCSFVWFPTFEELYPDDPKIISAGEIGNLFEGMHRFGHFDGVLTVVQRLFGLIKPEFAVFGEKDFQQLFLVKQMVANLDLPVSIISAPTIREASGLAISSRNSRLTITEQANASGIAAALEAASSAKDLVMARSNLLSELKKIPGFALDYAEIIDETSFEIATTTTRQPRAIVAGWINGVRLLDNKAMLQPGTSK